MKISSVLLTWCVKQIFELSKLKNISVFRRLLSLSTPTLKLEIVNGCMVNLESMSLVLRDFTSMESVVQEVVMTVDS